MTRHDWRKNLTVDKRATPAQQEHDLVEAITANAPEILTALSVSSTAEVASAIDDAVSGKQDALTDSSVTLVQLQAIAAYSLIGNAEGEAGPAVELTGEVLLEGEITDSTVLYGLDEGGRLRKFPASALVTYLATYFLPL